MFRGRSSSTTLVVLVLLIIALLQSMISYSLSFGRLGALIPDMAQVPAQIGSLAVRAILMAIVLVLWALNRKIRLFQAIIAFNAFLTLGLLASIVALVDVLFAGFSARAVVDLLGDVVLMAVSNVLIFSIWYWIIDPPGIQEIERPDEAWDFLFPQREGGLPFYEFWVPKYTDYLYLAFTTTLAFSPADTLPLSRRAKLMMILQAVISIVTIVVVAGSAVGLLGSGGGAR
jgi:hypothetical protein